MSIIAPTVPAPILPRRRQLLFGATFASAGFGAFILTAVGMYLQARAPIESTWLSEHAIPLTQPNVQLGTLIMSLFTVQWAAYSIKRDDRGHAFLALAITLLFGLAFLNQTWFLFTQIGLPMATVEGPLFYLVVGGHLVMVGVAIVFLALMTVRAIGGNFSSSYPDGLSAAALFWHAMVAMYTVVWLTVYIMK